MAGLWIVSTVDIVNTEAFSLVEAIAVDGPAKCLKVLQYKIQGLFFKWLCSWS